MTDDSKKTDDLVRTPESEIGPPPIMRTWRRFYALVLAILAADVAVFIVVTRVFS
jgi:hypothetical protein